MVSLNDATVWTKLVQRYIHAASNVFQAGAIPGQRTRPDVAVLQILPVHVTSFATHDRPPSPARSLAVQLLASAAAIFRYRGALPYTQRHTGRLCFWGSSGRVVLLPGMHRQSILPVHRWLHKINIVKFNDNVNVHENAEQNLCLKLRPGIDLTHPTDSNRAQTDAQKNVDRPQRILGVGEKGGHAQVVGGHQTENFAALTRPCSSCQLNFLSKIKLQHHCWLPASLTS